MKTRNEIYQGEGAQLLRFITTYHSLQYEQVLRLFSKNRESIKSLAAKLISLSKVWIPNPEASLPAGKMLC